MSFQETYNAWLNSPFITAEVGDELSALSSNVKEIEDRFYKDLEFGTGGLRGVIGAGTNRMNAYTVRRATLGLANFLKGVACGASGHSVAIAYDSRRFSPEFAMEAALVLATSGIKAYLYEGLRTTPQLSYTVRELGCSAGIVITASHNPPEYNGYKVYGPDGCQITSDYATGIMAEIKGVAVLQDWGLLGLEAAVENNLIEYLGNAMDTAYVNEVKGLAVRPGSDVHVVYTPLHGTGLMPIEWVLGELGYSHIDIVEAQAMPDGNFSTVKSPNPEERDAFEMGIAQAMASGARLVLGTDPDCDRVGLAERVGGVGADGGDGSSENAGNGDGGEFVLFTGNQIGALLVDYMLGGSRVWPENGAIIKTVVTSELGAQIARSKGFAVKDTLTGFKYIGELIGEFERSGEHTFIMGYEESYGYLAGDFVRDKDAVIASMLIVEMASFHYERGVLLSERLAEIYSEFGYYFDALDAITKKGVEGLAEIKGIMGKLRDLEFVAGAFEGLVAVEDYGVGVRFDVVAGSESAILLPKSDVLKFFFDDGSWIAVRPSGTEPKIKFYYSVIGENEGAARVRYEELRGICLGLQ